MELTIEDKIKLLETKLADQQQLILQDIFRELRELTRQAYPERFINSWLFLVH